MTVSFRDYSDVLIPLPPLNSGLPAPASSTPSSTESPDFLSVLGPLIDNQSVDAPLSAAESEQYPQSWLFDLGARRPAITASGSTDLPFTVPLEISSFALSDSSHDNDELLSACREIEGYLLGILLKDLGKPSAGSSLFSRTWESSFYQNMFFLELADAIGKQGPGLGIAEVIMDDIIMKAGETS